MSLLVVAWLMVAVGLVTVPAPPWRRRAGLAIGWLAVAVPAVLPRFAADPPVVLFLSALGAACALARGWELGRETTPRRWWARVFHTTTLFDSRTASRARRELRWRDGLAATAFVALAAVGFALAYFVAAAAPAALYWPIRLLGGLLLVYGAMDGLAAGMTFGYALAGWRIPALHATPIASRSLGEFWGERWNRPVSAWLRRACFLPLARRGHASLGVLWAFVVSGLLHVYLTAVAVGLGLALWVGALFVVHGLLLSVERVLSVRRWPAAAGRAWFVATMAATAPLFIEPLLRVIWPGR